MDIETFAALSRRLAGGQTRSLSIAGSRRPVLVGLLAGAIGLLDWGRAEEAAAHDTLAKCKKIKDKTKKKTCVKKAKKHNATHTTLIPSSPPPPPPCGGACAGNTPQCCPATTQDPGGLCAGASDKCCKSAEGGGVCQSYLDEPDYVPKCCPPTEQFPNGLCADFFKETCCPSNKGGFVCPSDQACCATSDDCIVPDTVCSASNCCEPDTGVQSQVRRPDRHERRHG
jgi:hypothetical protein